MKNSSWQKVSHAEDSRATVLLFPPTGAGAPAFRSARALQGVYDSWAYCPPGRGTRFGEPGFTEMEKFVEDTVATIDLDDSTLVVAGVSFGAALGFTVCAALEGRDVRVDRLVAICGVAPGNYVRTHTGWDLDSARARMIDYGLTPREVLEMEDADEIFVQPTLDDLLLADSYGGSGGVSLHANLTCVTASDDHLVPESEAVSWEKATQSTFKHLHLPGGHYAHADFGTKEWIDVLS
ncbi:external thioesterase TEII [Rathayibacter agropyri]